MSAPLPSSSSTASPEAGTEATTATATATTGGGGGWGWAGSWIGSIVNTSKHLVDEYTKDLAEFVEVVQTDTHQHKDTVEKKLSEVTDQVGKNLLAAAAATAEPSQLLDSLNSTLTHLISPGTPGGGGATSAQQSAAAAGNGGRQGVNSTQSGAGFSLQGSWFGLGSPAQSPAAGMSGSQIFDRFQADLDAIRRDPGTYCNEPALKGEEWDNFCRSFNLSEKTEEISRLLSSHSEMRALHKRLVPAAVPHDVFWQRYFLRVELMEKENTRRRKILDEVTQQAEEEINWDDDDEDDNNDVKHEELKDKEAAPAQPPSVSISSPETKNPSAPAASSLSTSPSKASPSGAGTAGSSPPRDKHGVAIPPMRLHSEDFELLTSTTATSTATTPPVDIMDDELFEKAINEVQLTEGALNGDDDWGSDWE